MQRLSSSSSGLVCWKGNTRAWCVCVVVFTFLLFPLATVCDLFLSFFCHRSQKSKYVSLCEALQLDQEQPATPGVPGNQRPSSEQEEMMSLLRRILQRVQEI